jgi:hypothetical protein
VRKRHHDFKVSHPAGKDPAHRPAVVDARDPFLAAAVAGSAAFFGWQRGDVAVGQVHVLHRPAPIDQTSVVRLVVGAPVRQRQRSRRAKRREAACAHDQHNQKNNKKNS